MPTLQEVTQHYDIPINAVTDTGDNKWHVETDHNLYTLHLYDDSTKQDQKQCITILELLNRNNYLAPRLISTLQGDTISKWEEKTGYLTTMPKGNNPPISTNTFYQLGVTTGRLHAINTKGSDIPECKFNIPTEQKRFKKYDTDPTIRNWEGYTTIRNDLTTMWENLPNLDHIPQVLIHTDIMQWTTVQTPDGLIPTNWDCAGMGAAIIDIGRTFSAHALQPDKNVLRTEVAGPFLDGYLTQRSLSTQELQLLPHTIAFGTLFLIMATWQNRISEEFWWRTKHILNHRHEIVSTLQKICTTHRTAYKTQITSQTPPHTRPNPTPQQFQERYGFPVDTIKQLRSSERAWQVNIGQKIWVLRLHNHQMQENHAAEIAALKFLERTNHPAPRLIPTHNGEYLTHWGNYEGYTTTYLPGERIELTLETIQEIGQAIAKVHALNVKNADIPDTIFSVDHKRALFQNNENDPKVQAYEGFAEIQPDLRTMWKNLPDFTDLPRVLIHSDLLVHNLIRHPSGNLVLIDWEGSGIGSATQDIGYFLRQYAILPGKDALRVTVASAFLNAYTKIRPLSPKEWKAIPDAMIFGSIFAAIWYDRVNEPAWWRTKHIVTYREQIAERLASIASQIQN